MNFSDMFKNFGDIRGKMEDVQKRISALKITGEAGAGMVKVTVSGEGKVLDVKLDRNMLGPEENEMLEELLISATNDALTKAREAAAHEMKSITGGLNIPGLDKMFGGGGL